MSNLLELALGNVAVASLLVFIKLLTPPLLSVPILRLPAPVPVVAAPAVAAAPAAIAPIPFAHEAAPEKDPDRNLPRDQTQIVDRGTVPAAIARSAPSEHPPQNPAPPSAPVDVAGDALAETGVIAAAASDPAELPAEPWTWSWLPAAIGWVWLAGAAAWFGLAAVRVLRFQRLLRLARPPSAELRALAKSVARKMDLRSPRLALMPGLVSPMLWTFGRKARLVVPESLLGRLTTEQWRTLLAHELAHWRRRDHWVRWLELLALGIYWWCPLVWWAKRELQQAEEECCDAWVVTTLPGAARAYALALVETLDFLSGARTVLPPAASGLGHIHLLRRRVTMILRGRTPRALTLTGLVAVVTLGLVLLPWAPSWAQAPPAAQQAVAQEPAGQEPDKKEEKADKKDDKDSPAAAREEFQRLQDSMMRLQQEMAQKRREFEEKLNKEFGEKQRDLMARMQEMMRKAGAGGFPGGPGGFAPGPNPNFAPLVPGQPAFPGAFQQPGGLGGFGGGPRPDVERRLDELERKIDRLMEKLGGNPPPKGNRPPGKRDPNAPPSPPDVDRGGGADAPPPARRPPQPPAQDNAPPIGREE